jgi:ERF superfamily
MASTLGLDPENHIATQHASSRSESIAKLAEALSAAQGEIEGAAKDSENPYFKSRYADLLSVWNACRNQLSKHGLAVVQMPQATEFGIQVETILAHSSGEWISSILALPSKNYDAQGLGSAITYARRYALAAMVGIAPEDDDGNAASPSMNQKANSQTPHTPSQLTAEEQGKLEDWARTLEKEVTDLSAMNAAMRQLAELPKGLLRVKCWTATCEFAKQQGWVYSPKQTKFIESTRSIGHEEAVA